jgi:integrase
MNIKENRDNWICPKCKTLNLYAIRFCKLCQGMKKRKLQDFEQPIVTRERLLELMQQTYSLRIRALFCFLYLTGSRISEVIRHIRASNFEIADLEGTEFLYINRIPVLKKKKAIVRQVAVNIKKERAFVEPLMEYVLFVSERRDENVPLWNLSRVTAYRFMREITCREYPDGLFNHFFRHQRLSHLVLYYGFNQNELKEFSKHTNITNLDFYVHLSSKDIARKML